VGVPTIVAEAMVAAQASVHEVESRFNPGRANLFEFLKTRLLRATACDCMEVRVYAWLQVNPGDLTAVRAAPGMNRGLRRAAEESVMAYLEAVHGDDDHDVGSEAARARVDTLKKDMLVLAWGECPPHTCPVQRPDAVKKVLQAWLTGLTGEKNQTTGPYDHQEKKCYAVEIVRSIGAPGNAVPGTGGRVAFAKPLKYVMRYVFCFYNYAPSRPTDPGDPGYPEPPKPTTPRKPVPPPPPPPPERGPTPTTPGGVGAFGATESAGADTELRATWASSAWLIFEGHYSEVVGRAEWARRPYTGQAYTGQAFRHANEWRI